MKLGTRLIVIFFALFSWFHATAQGAFYTVQVVALTDRDSALSLVSDLLKEGFPAYVVNSKSQEGDLFRIRVGSFADRAASVAYIEVMPEIAGGRAVPALAEGIPAGLVPAHTALKMHVPVASQPELVIDTDEQLLLRTRAREEAGEQYEYYAFDTRGQFQVEAYRVVPGSNNDWFVLRDMALWPEHLVDDSPEIQETFRESLLALLEDRLAVSREQLEAAAFYVGDFEMVRVVERYHPSSQLAEVVALVWLEDEARVFSDAEIGEYFAQPARSAEAVTELVPSEPEIMNEEWFAAPEGDFVRLSVNEDGVPGKSWRAATGTPLRFVLSGLLTLDSTSLYYYAFPAR